MNTRSLETQARGKLEAQARGAVVGESGAADNLSLRTTGKKNQDKLAEVAHKQQNGKTY